MTSRKNISKKYLDKMIFRNEYVNIRRIIRVFETIVFCRDSILPLRNKFLIHDDKQTHRNKESFFKLLYTGNNLSLKCKEHCANTVFSQIFRTCLDGFYARGLIFIKTLHTQLILLNTSPNDYK